jgi:magnesium transporter
MTVRVRSFELREERVLARARELPEGWPGDGVVRWIDVRGASHEELTAWLERLGLARTWLDEVVRPRRRAHILHGGGRILLALRDVGGAQRPRPATEFVLCLPDTVVTFGLDRRLRADVLLDQDRILLPPGPPVTGTLLLLFELVTEALFDRYLDLRDRADGLVRGADPAGKRLDVSRLSELVREAHALAFRCEERQYLVSTIHLLLAPAERTGPQSALFENATTNLDRVVSALDRLTQRFGYLHRESAMRQQRMTDQRVRVLAVVSAIFLPLTLLAGIYGMNFHRMPELDWPAAYPAVLGLMGLTAAGLLVLFWRKGWFT